MRLLSRIAFFAVAPVLAACTSSTGPEDALVVTPTVTTVTRDAQGNATVNFTVLNTGGRDVYLATCGGTVGAVTELRTAGGQWLAEYDVMACYSSLAVGPQLLVPGATVTGSQTFHAAAPGQYRLKVLVALKADENPERQAWSSAITVN